MPSLDDLYMNAAALGRYGHQQFDGVMGMRLEEIVRYKNALLQIIENEPPTIRMAM
jgi:hypothetical protein